jgi:hypothetical protein
MSETAYNNWIYQQLEPTDILPHCKKPVQTKSKTQIYKAHQEKFITIEEEEEDNARQDAYLAKHGIF